MTLVSFKPHVKLIPEIGLDAHVGNTPLLALRHVNPTPQVQVFAKAEWFNPGGSVKDRIGLPMVERFEREGKLKPGGTIVEGTNDAGAWYPGE